MKTYKPICIILLLIISMAAFIPHASAQPKEEFALQKGDLLFQDLDCGPLCEAIEKVTTGYKGAHLSHVGIVDKSADGQWIVIEAISPGVKTTPLDTFLARSKDYEGNPKVLVGRLKENHQDIIPLALDLSRKLLKKPYDKIYDMKADAYYCSELIYDVFMLANERRPVFQLQPMTFKDPETDSIFSVWKEYYENLNHPVPQGEPGLNPGSMSLSVNLEIVHYYGKPENFNPEK